jgi:glycosyltransferase involved in cell wall biosynthesis
MILVIDATNLSSGGGLTHIKNIIKFAKPIELGFQKVIIFGSIKTLACFDDFPWLEKINLPIFEKNFLWRACWQTFKLGKSAKSYGATILFVPGGSFSTSFRPIITMSRNLLPFEWSELKKYGFSITFFRLCLLKYIQSKSFKNASGLIFLTNYAKTIISKQVQVTNNNTIIPHGIDSNYFRNPKVTAVAEIEFSNEKPFRLIYVSIIDVYKHHREVIESIRLLRQKGLYISIDFVGSYYKSEFNKVLEMLNKIEDSTKFIKYHGSLNVQEQIELYTKSDLCLFASSCENMPNILLEGMASGLPIISSNRGPMPEILNDAGLYFNPENPIDISNVIEKLYFDSNLRNLLAIKSFEKAKKYSWESCSNQTLDFLSKFRINN